MHWVKHCTMCTFQSLIDSKVKSHVGGNAEECWKQSSIQTPAPEATFLLENGSECMSDVSVGMIEKGLLPELGKVIN